MEKNLKILKENLAQNLKDEGVIKSYLRADKLSNFDLLKMAYGPFEDNLKIKLSLVISPITAGLIPILSLIHISEPTRPCGTSRMPSSA